METSKMVPVEPVIALVRALAESVRRNVSAARIVGRVSNDVRRLLAFNPGVS
jgi:hypothetical protein